MTPHLSRKNLACGLAAAAVLAAGPGPAATAGASSLQDRIAAGQSRIGALQSAVGHASGQVAALGAELAPLTRNLGAIQADLANKRAELLRLQTSLADAQAQLARLEVRQAAAEQVLSRQLVDGYESDRPDIVTVVLQARGFKDLLERLTFATKIRRQDAAIVADVRAARRGVSEAATRLGRLEQRQVTVTTEVLAQRNQLARAQLALLAQQTAAQQRRQASADALAATRAKVASLRDQLARIEAAQAARARAAEARVFGPIQVASGGGFAFPLPKGAAVSQGSWTLDDGVDIAAPGNTPLLAVASGTVVGHGIGGFGPSAPILHLDSGPYVYYGHAGPGNWVAIGTHVAAGQIISEVGAGIVGFSTGPHLEIGFCDASGTPLGPGSAPRMMSLLQGAYGG